MNSPSESRRFVPRRLVIFITDASATHSFMVKLFKLCVKAKNAEDDLPHVGVPQDNLHFKDLVISCHFHIFPNYIKRSGCNKFIKCIQMSIPTHQQSTRMYQPYPHSWYPRLKSWSMKTIN